MGETEIHGWAIMKATRRTGPAVYQVLERLTRAGWLDQRWEEHHPEPNKPRRRFYRLTGEGATHARALLAEHRPTTWPNPHPRPHLRDAQA